jgi:hypothetical protein
LKAAYEELSQMLENENDLADKDEYTKAKQVMEEAKIQLV